MGGKITDYLGKNLAEVFGTKTGRIFIDRLELASKSAKPIQFEDRCEGKQELQVVPFDT